MDEARRRIGLRAGLGLLAIALVVTVLWAASAMAAGGSGANAPASDNSPAVANTQQNESDARDHDCPNRGSAFESSDV